MKLKILLGCALFIIAFSIPVLAVTPLGQIDSFDNIVGTGWTEVSDTNLMRQELEPNNVYEGIGSMRIKFEDGNPSTDPNDWQVTVQREIALDVNNSLALTFWTNNNAVSSKEHVEQLIVFQGDNKAWFNVPGTNTGWRKITAAMSAFTPDPNNSTAFDMNAIDKIQFYCSTYDVQGGSVWIDDLRLEAVPVYMSPCQIDSFDNIAAFNWYDDRKHGWMFQAPPGEVNEGTGSMKLDFTLWNTGGNVDIEPIRIFNPPLDFNDYKNLAITLWVWSDRTNSKFREIILYDDANHNGRFVAHPPDSNGWTKVVANLTAFSWYTDNTPVSPHDVNWSSIRTIGLFSSCGETIGYNHAIYYDDLRIDSNQVFLSDATIVNADRTFGTIIVDGCAADWATLDDSDVVDFDLAAVPDQPRGNLHVKYRLAWDPNYLYILVEEVYGDTLIKEALQVGGFGVPWSLNDHLGGDAYYDALALYFDFTNIHWILGGEEGISLWLYLGLASQGQTNLMMAWTNADWGNHKPAAVANGNYAETGTGLGNRVVEARISWQDVNSAVDSWRLPEGGLPAAIKPGYIFGCNPRVNDSEKSSLWNFTVEKGTAWLNGKMWDWQGTPSAIGIYAKDVRLVCSAADLDYDCHVNFKDYAQFAEEWYNDGCNNLNNFCNGADIVIDGAVDTIDLAELAQEWLSE